MNQITLFDITERELKYCELPEHIGERLHYRITKDEVLREDQTADEYVTLLSVGIRPNKWMQSEFQAEDGKRYTWLSNPDNDKYGARTHLFVEVPE